MMLPFCGSTKCGTSSKTGSDEKGRIKQERALTDLTGRARQDSQTGKTSKNAKMSFSSATVLSAESRRGSLLP